MSDCPQFTALLRWRDAGDEARVDAHLATCPDCAGAWSSLADLTALGLQLPDGLPEPRQIESARTAILAQAEAPAPRRSYAWVAVAAALVLGLAAWSLWPIDAAPDAIATIDGATAEYAVHREAGVERVALRAGRVSIEVAHLPTDQRFVVQTADAEIEVRGTRFTVTAADGRLQRVEVQDGRVEVRRSGHPVVSLGEGQRWIAATPEAPKAPPSPAPPSVTPSSAPPSAPPRVEPMSAAPKRAAPPRPRPATPATRVPTPEAPAPSPQTEQFEAGWQALRAGDFDEASAAFSAAARLRGPLAADARWWQIVALGRAGRDAQTRAALIAFVKARPKPSRFAEAQVMLGWLEFARGSMDAAERAFQAGVGAQRAKVRSGAKAGLKAVADWRAKAR